MQSWPLATWCLCVENQTSVAWQVSHHSNTGVLFLAECFCKVVKSRLFSIKVKSVFHMSELVSLKERRQMLISCQWWIEAVQSSLHTCYNSQVEWICIFLQILDHREYCMAGRITSQIFIDLEDLLKTSRLDDHYLNVPPADSKFHDNKCFKQCNEGFDLMHIWSLLYIL